MAKTLKVKDMKSLYANPQLEFKLTEPKIDDEPITRTVEGLKQPFDNFMNQLIYQERAAAGEIGSFCELLDFYKFLF